MSKILWALFGNDEDGIYGDASFNPERKKSVWLAVKWWWRNPFHNLCFHVLNVPEPFTSVGDFPRDVFNPNGGWNKVIRTDCNGNEHGFISYIGWCKFYVGPRERGNFGIRFTTNPLLVVAALVWGAVVYIVVTGGVRV